IVLGRSGVRVWSADAWLPGIRAEDDGDWAVVNDPNGHLRPEGTGLDPETAGAEPLDEPLEQRPADLRPRRLQEAGTILAAGVRSLGQPALDIGKDLLMADLVEDLVVHPRVKAEGAPWCGCPGEEPLASRRVNDAVVAAVHQQERHAQRRRPLDQRLTFCDR